MGKTKIEWCDRTWSPVTGCTPISEGCANCYAARMAKRLAGRYGYPTDDPFKPGTQHLDKLDEPMHWRKSHKTFVCSMGDLFHDDVPFSLLGELWLIMRRAERHTFLILTKRPSRMLAWLESLHDVLGDTPDFPLKNLWLGVTAENQRTADERIPILLQIPAAKRFVSVEPMLEPVDLDKDYGWKHPSEPNTWCHAGLYGVRKLDWVIAGPETGPKARPMDRQWIADLALQSLNAGVPFFDKRDTLGQGLQEWPR